MADEGLQKLESLGESASLNVGRLQASIRLPREELFGLTSQIRRCSASIGANIAEGCGKHGNNEFQRYLQIAAGSASKLDYHFLLGRDLEFFEDVDYRGLSGELLQIRKMLTSLLQKVQSERFAG
ncbi:MAG: four helix bundle protein [Terriglobales bacterium]